MDFMIIYIDAADKRIVHTRRAVHTDVAALAPDEITPLLAIAVDMKTGEVRGYNVYEKTVADETYREVDETT